MNFIKMLNKNLFLYGNAEKEDFDLIKKQREKHNYRIWRTASLVSFIYFFLLFLSAFPVGVVRHNTMVYAVMSAITLTAYILFSTVAKPGRKLLMPLVYTTAGFLLYFGIILGEALSPHQLAVTFHVFLIFLPLIIVDRPYKMSILELAMAIFFIVMCVIHKEGEVAELDIFNAIVFAVLGQFVNYYMSVRSIRQLITSKRIEIASFTDDLTKMNNRKAYERDINRLRDSKDEDRVCVIFDVNGLKSANDGLGHSAGDELLKGAASCIKNCFDPYGKTYRTGGDEFVAIIRADGEQMLKIANEYQSFVENWHGDLVEKLSISMGYATSKEFPELSLRELLKTADKRMYEEKDKYYELVKASR